MQNQQDPSTNYPSRWNEMKSDLGRSWNKISSDEWEKTHGDEDSMSSILQERYGLSETDASEKLNGLLGKYRGEEDANDLGRNPERIIPKGQGQEREQNFNKSQNDAGQTRDVDQRFGDNQNFGKNQSNQSQTQKPGFKNPSVNPAPSATPNKGTGAPSRVSR